MLDQEALTSYSGRRSKENMFKWRLNYGSSYIPTLHRAIARPELLVEDNADCNRQRSKSGRMLDRNNIFCYRNAKKKIKSKNCNFNYPNFYNIFMKC